MDGNGTQRLLPSVDSTSLGQEMAGKSNGEMMEEKCHSLTSTDFVESRSARQNLDWNAAHPTSAKTVIALLSNDGMDEDASKIGGMVNHEHENDGHGKRYDMRLQEKGDR